MTISQFEKDLRESTTGEVYFDSIHKHIYSVDASIYEIEPVGVFIPKTKEDLISAIKIAYYHDVPVIARGAATGITGGCLGKGLIIDIAQYLHQIEEINFHKEYAICQPGVVQDDLNKTLSIRGYRLGPDTSTGDRATLAGMMANNAAGARSLYYGKMVDHVIGVELILASGEKIYFEELDEEQLKHKLALNTIEGNIYREVIRIRDQYREDIESHFPKIPRRVSGYNLDELIKPGPLNIAKLITGSEGTLGIATQIKVKIVKQPLHQGLCVLFFHSMQEAMQAIAPIMDNHPMSLELIDEQIISRGRESPSMRGKLDWLQGSPQAILVVEFEAPSQEDLWDLLDRFAKTMKQKQIGRSHTLIMDPLQIKHVWDLRKAGLGLLLSKRTYSRAIAFIEDLSIDPQQLPAFMEKFQAYLKSVEKEAGIYGHAGSGCLHIRPFIDLRHQNELQLMKKMMEEISDLVLEHHGAMSGEHGDGIIRSWLNEKMFGEKIYQAFRELKAAFDPDDLMNPGKVVNGPDVLENLRLFPEKPIHEIKTFLDFSKEGGFALAADLCNGNGFCRKKEGVMCPSFQATENEYDTTRARAQVLRTIIHDSSSQNDLSQEGLHDVLDLCLQCKGCKTECPSQVDMAKMKSEVLYQYQKQKGISLRNRLFGHLSHLFSWGSMFPRLTNFLTSNALSKWIFVWLGISPERTFPQLARKRFSEYASKSKVSKNQVILFNDTFTEFLSPQVGLSAVKVLENLGYEVTIPSWKCCGRPLLSKGLLPEAQKQARELVQHLMPYAKQGLPIIGLEPSCLFTLVDDYPSLLPQENLDILLKSAITFDEFISNQIHDGKLPLSYHSEVPCHVLYHVHCYQKSLLGSQHTKKILNAIPDCHVTEIQSGCCGMAGSFGYEKEHYHISMRIGNLTLFPTIHYTAENTMIIANGFSCRSQIHDGTQKKAMHLAEFLFHMINN